MAIQINYNKDKTIRTISDDENPRIYYTEYACYTCGSWLREDEVIWAKEDGTLDTDKGNPYCDCCLPSEE
jgi:hypothetical protein